MEITSFRFTYRRIVLQETEMKVVDAGHKYLLDKLDSEEHERYTNEALTFVKRNYPPDKYPGNENAYSGTTIQEVCRVLIDRCKYVNNQERSGETEACITYFRRAILELETRATKRHNRGKITFSFDIENMPTCRICGHIGCNEICRKEKCKYCDSIEHLTAEHHVGGMTP